MANVFLSYDHEDTALARPIAAGLEKAGHTVWYDRHIHGGAQYSRKIEQALDDADAVVVLWSPRSLESAWVRDEAADGRDRGKLVPLSVGGVAPPMGFRQFQTIALGGWKGRGKVPRLPELLEAIEGQAQQSRRQSAPPPPQPSVERPSVNRRRIAVGAGAIALLLALAVGTWTLFGRSSMPVIAVAAANTSARSQAAASDLFVKLGSLAQIGEGKWRLVDAASAPKRPEFVFRAADTGSPGRPQANLVFLDGKDDNLLWSREFSMPTGSEADLRQQMALTTGRVLGCALETREAGGLPRGQLKLFLNACALLAETSMDEPEKSTHLLRAIVAEEPRFTPAWGRLISADIGLVSLKAGGTSDDASAVRELRADMDRARKVAPDLPELRLAEVALLPATAYARRLDLLARAVEKAPTKAELFTDQSGALQSVGRMSDAIASARRAAQLDPLSPAVTTQLIMALAYGGQADQARAELSRAERLWAGTDALRDALWSFHLRYGDPALASKYSRRGDDGLQLYLNARADPSPANVEKLAVHIRAFGSQDFSSGQVGWAIQALGEFARIDEVLGWIARAKTDIVAGGSYIFFRPGLAPLRRDVRFMKVAKHLGLVDYWRASGKWPDFCDEPSLPYDCKAEAAKYG